MFNRFESQACENKGCHGEDKVSGCHKKLRGAVPIKPQNIDSSSITSRTPLNSHHPVPTPCPRTPFSQLGADDADVSLVHDRGVGWQICDEDGVPGMIPGMTVRSQSLSRR